MNKKTFFLILLVAVLALPVLTYAAEVPTMVQQIETAAKTIGTSVVVIGWVIAGVLYLTAGGSPEKTGLAKKALIAAIIGTAIIILAAGAEGTIKQLLGNPT